MDTTPSDPLPLFYLRESPALFTHRSHKFCAVGTQKVAMFWQELSVQNVSPGSGSVNRWETGREQQTLSVMESLEDDNKHC